MTPTAEFLQQHAALTGDVGYAPLDRTLLEIRGSDRAALLHAFCTADVKKLTPGQGCEAFVTSAQGKTLGHVLISCESDRLVLDTAAHQAEPLIEHLSKYVISEDVEFRDLTPEWHDVLVAGPRAAALLQSVVGAEPPRSLLSHSNASLGGHEVAISAVDYAGPQSFFVRASAVGRNTILAELTASGAHCCDAEVVESARLEAGFPLFGRDITPDNLPQEVRRDARAISFTKGCYLGQETVARIDALGHVNRLLVGLKFLVPDVPPPGTSLQSGEKTAGEVTSATWSPRLAAPLAMGYVRRPMASPGTRLETDLGAAEVVVLPLI